jgi:hypothetical protein
LKGLFDQTKKIYCQFPEQDGHFLSSDELNIREPNHRETIRTTNLATWVSIVFGAQLFSELNENFIDHFTPRHAPLSKEAGQLCIEFKTQMYLSAVSVEEQEKTKEDLLDELFPSNLESILADRHPDIPISVSEMEFVKDIAARRDFLMIQNDDVDSTRTYLLILYQVTTNGILEILLEKYAWEDFLQNLSAYLGAAYEPLIAPYMKRHSLTAPSSPARPAKKNNNHQDDIKAQVEQAAEEALRRLHAQTDYQSQLQKNASMSNLWFHSTIISTIIDFKPDSSQQHKTYPQQSQNGSYESLYAADPVYPPEQTAPTQVLYEQARQAAVAKANPGNTRRPGLPSQRRPWSTEEEHALMAGLDQVRGPHWSQILSLYGPGGSISEVLKDRNQVQLKDKARNLKLFFLKSSIEVPYYLKCVTGELKTRAPSQAARKEAEDRARQESEESNARSAGIRLLAGGMQPLPGANGLTGNMHAPTPARQQSPSPEHFHVVEPDRRGPGLPTTNSSNFDESLRHHLEASNALSSA